MASTNSVSPTKIAPVRFFPGVMIFLSR